MRSVRFLPIVLVAFLGCSEADGDGGVAMTTVVRADTILVTVAAPDSLPSLLVTLDSARIVWTPQELGRPNGMVVGPDGRVTVSDGAHLYAWQPGADTTEAVGREGSGPGEYRSIRGMVVEKDGSLLVLDARQRRMMHFDGKGKSGSAWLVSRDFAYDPFLALMDSTPVVLVGARLVRTGEPPDTLFLKPASGDTAAFLGRLVQLVWAEGPNGMLGPRDAYPPQALVSGTARAGFAFSDGLQYDIRWWRPGSSPHWLHLIRTWVPPPTSIDRKPPQQILEEMPGGPNMIQLIEAMQKGEHKYSLEDIVLMPGGTLWVMPVDSSYVYHPWYYSQLPELRQPTRLWEIFGADGTLRAQVRLSSMFGPRAIHNCLLYGFVEDINGVYSVGTIPLRTLCGALAGTMGE